jgi:hypothetical protein
MTIEELIDESYQTAKEHGWWNDPNPNIPEKIALMHSELSEALEEYRSGKEFDDIHFKGINSAPEGFLIELADVFIRISDLIGYIQLKDQFVRALQTKLNFNKTREYRHGNKKC